MPYATYEFRLGERGAIDITLYTEPSQDTADLIEAMVHGAKAFGAVVSERIEEPRIRRL